MTIQEIMNAPYVADGRDLHRDGGFDCWGFVVALYRFHGIEIPAFEGAEQSLIGMEKEKWQRHRTPQKLDVVLFDLPREGWHCGVVMPDLVSFAHCHKPKPSIDRLDSPIWKHFSRGFYSWVN